MLLELPNKSTGKPMLVNIQNVRGILPIINTKGDKTYEHCTFEMMDGHPYQIDITYEDFKRLMMQPEVRSGGSVAPDSVENLTSKLDQANLSEETPATPVPSSSETGGGKSTIGGK